MQFDTGIDYEFNLDLPFGRLFKTVDSFYAVGDKPLSLFYISETTKHTDTRPKNHHLWDDDDPTTWIMEEYTYYSTKYASLLTPTDIINKFIDLIKETTVIIKDAEFFLKFPIITTGIAKVYLDNCVAHLDGEGAGFVNISGIQSGSVISNNIIKPEQYHKYGSQNRMDYFPSKTEYHLKVNKNDKVVKSHTDKRGYPASCGIENKERDIIIIVRGG